MAEHTAQLAPKDKSLISGKGATANNRPRPKLWWAIVAFYLLIFSLTGYVAFIAPDQNLALSEKVSNIASRVSDVPTETLLMNMLKQEVVEHEQRRALAGQAFSVSLGALLGFLSASSVSKLKKN
jgi:hypothetical protein